MGQGSEGILDGTFCQHCGDIIDGEAPGYPRSCCQEDQPQTGPSEKVLGLLKEAGYEVESHRPINYGYQYRLTSGSVINIYDTGRFACQGKPDKALKTLLHQNIFNFR